MKGGSKNALSTEGICRGCSKGVVDAVFCPLCKAPFHKSCAERSSVLATGGYSKCCGSRPPSPVPPTTINLEDITRIVQSAVQSAIGTLQKDLGTLRTSLSQDFNKMLESVKSLEEKFDGLEGKFDGLPERVAGIERALDLVESRVLKIEGTLDSLDCEKQSVLDEIERRNSRRRNLMLFGLPERSLPNVPGGSTSDNIPTVQVQRFLEGVLPPNTLPSFDAFRIGNLSPDQLKPRPVKICCHDQLAAQTLLNAFLTATRKERTPATRGGATITSNPKGIRMAPDRTIQQLQQINEMKEALKTRLQNGEEGLRLVFRDNVPVLVSARPKKA